MGAVLLGLPLGLAVGYQGGWLDELIGRVLELVFALPWLLVAMVLAAIFSPSLNTALASLVVVYGPVVARVTRGAVLSERERDYVTAARVIGGSGAHIAVRHVLPNVVSPLVVLCTSIMSFAVLTEASLSYLGLGAQPPTPSWGRMLTESSTLFASAPHLTLVPGVAITGLVLALNLLGDALRDRLDPRWRSASRGQR
jgi:peptide/nickel transport system permease protein